MTRKIILQTWRDVKVHKEQWSGSVPLEGRDQDFQLHLSSRGWVIASLLDVLWASRCISTSVTGCITYGMALSATEASNAASFPTLPSPTFVQLS